MNIPYKGYSFFFYTKTNKYMIINLKSKTDLSGFYIVYEGSTNLEKPGWYGISHLMEHLVCKAFDHLQDDFDRDSIDWNAYTDSNNIVFYITGLDEKVNKWKYKLIELLSEFKITKEEFENERKIVLEEYSDYFNNQTDAHILNLGRKLFNDYDAIGLKKDLENLKYLDIINFWELQYSQPSKIINVSKNSDFENNLIDFANRKITRKLEFGNYSTPLELNNDFKGKSSIAIISPIIDSDFGYIHYINYMLSFGLKSPLYQEVREKRGLVYFIGCHQSRVNKQTINSITTQTSEKNFDTLVDVVGDVIKNPDKYLTKERFDIINDLLKTKRSIDDTLRHNRVSEWIEPKDYGVYSILDGLKFNKIREVYDKYFDFDKFYISNDRTEFKK